MNWDFTLYLTNEDATLAAGMHLASYLQPGMTVYLHGDLGAGKTTFVRGILHGLGYQGKVKSPTYTIVEPYNVSRFNIYHFDLYRFNDHYEWEAAGFRDYFNPQSICLIEWPEKAAELLPSADMDISLEPSGHGRTLSIRANSSLGEHCLHAMSK